MNPVLAVLAGTVATVLAAAPAAAQEGLLPAPPPRFSAKADTRWIGAVGLLDPADTWLNRGNQLLRLPQSTWRAELRVDARLEAGSRFQVVARPRLLGSIEDARMESQPAEWSGDATFELTEAFLSWRPTDSLSVTCGLQNFQWGPAELMGPSNRLFHETGTFRDPLTVVRGKQLTRMNLSAGRQWSFVALAELGATDEASFRAGAPFRRAGQAKLEYTTPSGGSYAGITSGVRSGEPPWFGGYAAVTLTDGLSAYLDASVQRGSQAWYPVSTGNGAFSFERNQREAGVRSLALAGLRYSFSATLDARIELLRQDAGYTRSQVAAGALAVAGSPSPESVEQWLRPGLEFLGRDLLFVSALASDLPPDGRLSLQGRYVRSFTDGSGAALVTARLNASDALVVFCSLTLTHGPELTEFTRLASAAGTVGLIWSW